MNESTIRQIIHSYALVFRYHFLDELILQPDYLLTYTLDHTPGFFNCAMNITVDSVHLDHEFDRIESYFRLRQKPPAIALESGTSSELLAKVLENRGYRRQPDEDCAMWKHSLDQPYESVQSAQAVEFRVVHGYDDFQDYLDTALTGWSDILQDYAKHASSLSKLYQHPHDGVKVFHIVGYVENDPVCTATLGVYFDRAHLINISVIPTMRRRGIASQMLSFAAQTAISGKTRALYVCIDRKDEPGTRLLEKSGFQTVVTQLVYVQHEA